LEGLRDTESIRSQLRVPRRPAFGMGGLGGLVESLAAVQDSLVVAPVALTGRDEADAAVAVLFVVPVDESGDPSAGLLGTLEGLLGEARGGTCRF
jgi:hypothetical protein